MKFDTLGLQAELLRAVAEMGYSNPTPIQQKAIPAVLEGGDILAGAQTGTGKTAGFTLPLLQRLHTSTKPQGKRPVRALILTPTRELAAQIGESVTNYGRYMPLSSSVIFGGVNIRPQINTLRKGVDIVVATPGRLLDHVSQKTLDLSQVEIVVLDEADRMLDMGFIHDIRKILALLPKKRQSLLFSATFSNEIKALADKLLHKPTMIEAEQRNTAAPQVSQTVYPIDKGRKRELLSHLIGSHNWQQVLVFARTKHGSNRLAQQLERDGIRSTAIHGNKSQGARTKALADFKSGKARVLVATDIAARGLDIEQLPFVVNYDLPNVPEDYVHRIGRTGRAGYTGQAISLVGRDETSQLRAIEKLLQKKIATEHVPGYERTSSESSAAPRSGNNGKNRNQSRDKNARQNDNSSGARKQNTRNGSRGNPSSGRNQSRRASA
ncbi:MAG: DEAD/DEAH box helicase [Desulfuromonadaceae bacterium]